MRNIASGAKPVQAKSDINSLLSALSMYKLNKGHYPSTQEGLKALVTSKAMTKIPLDPWGRDYIYRYPGAIDKNEPEIISIGEDALNIRRMTSTARTCKNAAGFTLLEIVMVLIIATMMMSGLLA